MSAPSARFDHLVVAVRSLPEGVAEFARRTGIRPVAGGRHPDRGTENALISLGEGGYFEIIAPQIDATLAPEDEAMRELDTLRIIDWAVCVASVDHSIAALRSAGFALTPPQPGSRVTPSGERLAWTTFRLAHPAPRSSPFFIHWAAGTRHPSTSAPGGCSLSDLLIQDPSPDRVAMALSAVGFAGARYAHGQSRIEATVRCASNAVTFTTPG